MRSDDPHTQVTARITHSCGAEALGVGWNRLARGVEKLPARLESPAKYSWLVHAEIDAIASCAAVGIKTKGCTMRLDWFPCPACASAIVQAGIAVLHVQRRAGKRDWEFGVSETILREGGVRVEESTC